MASPCKWIILSSPGNIYGDENPPLKINALEFGMYDFESKCIQKYNTIDNKWTQWIQLQIDDLNGFEQTGFSLIMTSFAGNESKLYAYINKKLIIINPKQNTHKVHDCNNYGDNAAIIVINNKLHLVGGNGSFDPAINTNKHSIWNEQQLQFAVKHEFDFRYTIGHHLIFLKCKNILFCLLFCNNASMESIYSFDITLNKWSKLKQKLPIGHYAFRCISTRFDKYIILFGGRTTYGAGGMHDKIYILNTKTMQFRQSGICCPTKGIFKAINMNSKEREELLCVGYIKQLWNTNEFNDLIHIPFYLMNIIRQYVVIEVVHLIMWNGHWKMNVDDIITTPVQLI